LRVTGQYVRLAATGSGTDGSYTEQIQDYQTSLTYSLTPPSSWGPIRAGVFERLGANSYCTVSDNSESWQLELINIRTEV